MKVLFNTYPMAFHTPGGGEMQLRAYQRYLTEAGIDVGLFNLWDPHFLDYDIVHFFSVLSGSAPFCGFVKQLKLPLVITSSLWITEETKHRYPWEEIRHQLSLADQVITNSHVESKQLSSVLGLPEEKFSVVYNGVDKIFFEKVSADIFRQHFKIDYPFVLNVGNVEPRKNQLNLLRAMKKFKELKLVVIGHVRHPEYAKECAEVGGDQYVFLGPLEHGSEMLRSAFAACEFFALPSTLETPGLAALEAAAQGARILITAVGAPKEYFGDKAIYVENPQSVEEIVERITQVLRLEKSNVIDIQEIKNKFLWDNVIYDLIRVYRDYKIT